MNFASSVLLTISIALLLAACGAKSSDEEQVHALIEAVESAAEARDTSDVLAHVSNDYADAQGLDKAQLTNFLRGYFLANPRLELLVGVESVEFPVDGLAQVVLTVTKVDLQNPDRERLNVELRRTDGQWRVLRADRAGR